MTPGGVLQTRIVRESDYSPAAQLFKAKFNKILGNEILVQIKDHNSGTIMRKMTCNNPKLDLVIMNAYIKFSEKMSVSSQDIEPK